MYWARCSGVPRSWIGESARFPARLPVAAPPSTHESSNAASASAKFFGPSMYPPCSISTNADVIPASSNTLRSPSFASVHSCVLRPPSATTWATGPRATARVDCTSIWRSNRSAKRHMIWRTSSPGSVLRRVLCCSPTLETLIIDSPSATWPHTGRTGDAGIPAAGVHGSLSVCRQDVWAALDEQRAGLSPAVQKRDA